MARLSADGLLLVDKPAGPTSHDVVGRARRALGVRRIGHHGTLDPFATGLLVLLVGRATRLAPFLDGEPKVYDAEIRFGHETESDDCTGSFTRSAPLPDASQLPDAVAQLTGTLSQVPPAVSAKQVGGERAHAAARAGRPLTLAPATVVVHEWTVHEASAERLRATIRCGGGTYIRALARDLGRLVGSAAHLAALRRVAAGPFHVRDAIPLAALDPAAPPPLRSPLEGLSTLARHHLDDVALVRVRHGGAAPVREADDTGAVAAALLAADGHLVAIAERAGEWWQPRVVLDDA